MTKADHNNHVIIALDTSGANDSIAARHNCITIKKILPAASSSEQSSRLIPEILDLLSQLKVSFDDVDTLLTVSGPGSFTGIRLGLATAQGLIFGKKINTYSLSKFELLAFQAQRKLSNLENFVTVVPKNREEFFYKIHHTSQADVNEVGTGLYANFDQLNLLKGLPVISGIPLPIESHIISDSNNAEDLINFYLTPKKNEIFSRGLTPYYLHNPEFKKQARFIHE